MPPSIAGDALLAAQLQEEDQVAMQTSCNVCTNTVLSSKSADFLALD